MTLEDVWDDFSAKVLGGVADTKLHEAMRNAFYAGSFAALDALIHDVPFDVLRAELNEYLISTGACPERRHH